jgi:DNA modification methylase
MIVDIIKDASDRDEIVLDGFGGSGTTLIAAEQCARTARLLELDPLYCDVILRRFSASSGQMPVLTQSGETFCAVEQRIRREADHG